MATLLRMPEVAAGATQAVLSQWLVRENVRFATGEAIAVLETDKASVEVEAEADAVILRTLVAGGAMVDVGAPIALLGEESEHAEIDKLLAGFGVGATTDVPAPARRDVEEPAPRARIFASPLARKLLKEAGIAPETVEGTGPNGRIVRRDVEKAVADARSAAAAEPAPSRRPPIPVPAGTGYREIPHSRLRRAVATRLTASKQEIPHFYVRRTARIDALLELRRQLNTVTPVKISVNDLVVRAVAVAHRRIPDANVIWTEDGMRQFESVDVAVAIASDRGLVTPVLRGVDKSTPAGISEQVRTFVQQATDGKLDQRDLEGGSIAVSNLGMYGVDEFSAIINPPQSAILAVGAGKPAPAVVEGELTIATQLALVLSVDHRAIDGALAARWMAALIEALEEPLRLLA
ncbi:dihydrolipoamide acetyltransferase family protein [Amycolatopsis sp. WQ 127309]|uniref:dihydrolipoamide acetyltransferase family protein n=1 Tax=Amycolatopsis sp. WQ 127309 TaxID=2932773 RepID=UPI001FF564D7|nr:dihydrolipoamide acetyltransferase family protein [Amycolatopsis sp. WQ 127309]UOZ03480.1 2-oxo acid dehydrogenase subunit E2 [Amycolatopsis sp. WQ 127309]